MGYIILFDQMFISRKSLLGVFAGRSAQVFATHNVLRQSSDIVAARAPCSHLPLHQKRERQLQHTLTPAFTNADPVQCRANSASVGQ